MSDYRIQPVAVDGFADADGVYENERGAWLGEYDGDTVRPYSDEGGDYVPAPENWRELIIEALRQAPVDAA
jgi:hypothetical protein